ncbi:MAG: hypothetical protein ABJA37_05580 [Ferruginibacter sp.]
MEDRYGKYVRLFSTLFFTMVGLIIAFILLLLGIRLIFGLLSFISWSAYIYTLLIMMVPAVLFISIFIIYFKRTVTHPSSVVRYISYAIFSVALIFWSIFLVRDVATFFKYAYTDIEKYNGYNYIFLSANVATIFIVGIMQAFSMPKEKDWMERNREKERESD